ncbi:unnamed protein product [Echinostoma caproni]|uniref:Suppressor protein SRP40 n=1 Tax=Echinostoma caproni TaxID=27848 RepID=A0A183AEU4_9TREM|nr:unnamed protein product [Echinostoma caproni]
MSIKKKKFVSGSQLTLSKKGTSLKKKLKKEKKKNKKKQKDIKKKLGLAAIRDGIKSPKMQVKEKLKKTTEDKLKKKKEKLKVSKNKCEKEVSKPRKSNKFGAASSDSEPEPIDSNWNLNDPDEQKDSWHDAQSDIASESDDMASQLSDDLADSETDYDEELNEAELNSLIVSNRKRVRDSSGGDTDEDVASDDADETVYSTTQNAVDKGKPVTERKKKQQTSTQAKQSTDSNKEKKQNTEEEKSVAPASSNVKNKLPVSTVSTENKPVPSDSSNKVKVLIQSITDTSDTSEEDADDEVKLEANKKRKGVDLFAKLGDLDETDHDVFLRKPTDSTTKPTSTILTDLVRSHKASKSDNSQRSRKGVVDLDAVESSEVPEDIDEDQENADSSEQENDSVATDDDDDDDDDDNDDDDDDDDDVDEDDEGESNDSTNESGSEAEESADDDDPDDVSVNDHSSEASDASENSTDPKETSILFKRAPVALERNALDAMANSSEEQIDKTLRAVIQSRRTAMRALKTAGSKRPWLSTGQGAQKRQKSALAKARKPFEGLSFRSRRVMRSVWRNKMFAQLRTSELIQ